MEEHYSRSLAENIVLRPGSLLVKYLVMCDPLLPISHLLCWAQSHQDFRLQDGKLRGVISTAIWHRWKCYQAKIRSKKGPKAHTMNDSWPMQSLGHVKWFRCWKNMRNHELNTQWHQVSYFMFWKLYAGVWNVSIDKKQPCLFTFSVLDCDTTLKPQLNLWRTAVTLENCCVLRLDSSVQSKIILYFQFSYNSDWLQHKKTTFKIKCLYLLWKPGIAILALLKCDCLINRVIHLPKQGKKCEDAWPVKLLAMPLIAAHPVRFIPSHMYSCD